MREVTRIEISFPVPVEFPPGWEQALHGLLCMICKHYEVSHPARVMWPFGCGAKVSGIHTDEPEFDDDVYEVVVDEQEASDKEKKRRKREAHQ